MLFPEIKGFDSFTLNMREYFCINFKFLNFVKYHFYSIIAEKQFFVSLSYVFNDKSFDEVNLSFPNSQMNQEVFESLMSSIERSNYIRCFKLNLAEFFFLAFLD